MTLTVAIQMDPIANIDIDGDSTFVLALEAQKRGYQLYHYLPQALSLQGRTLSAWAHPLTVRRRVGESFALEPSCQPNPLIGRRAGDHFTLGDGCSLDLSEVDVILMRQDPPFDLAYITATHLLEHVPPRTLVVNDPAAVRNAPEKLLVTHFPDLMPPTLISADVRAIQAFRAEHRDIIIKPLFGNGGAGVFHLRPDDENLNALLEMFLSRSREPLMIQRYLPEVRDGDKRIILIDGEPVGAVNRIPADGEARSNMHVGGRAQRCNLTRRELEICAAIGPTLRDSGLIFVGIDVIGDYLTEINVTSPTGLQQINRFEGTCLEADIWDAIERRLRQQRD